MARLQRRGGSKDANNRRLACAYDVYGFDYRWLEEQPHAIRMDWPLGPIPTELLAPPPSPPTGGNAPQAPLRANSAPVRRQAPLLSEVVREREDELARLEEENLQLRLVVYTLRERCKKTERVDAERSALQSQLRDAEARLEAVAARYHGAERRAARECSTNKALRSLLADQQQALRRAVGGWRTTVAQLGGAHADSAHAEQLAGRIEARTLRSSLGDEVKPLALTHSSASTSPERQ